MSETTVTLPFPKSVNGTFKRFNGSNLSKGYREWRDEASYMLMSQRPAKIAGRVSVDMVLVNPNRVQRDIDNLFKGVLDLLVKHGVIEDDNDRFVRRVSAEWADAGPACTVTIRSVA